MAPTWLSLHLLPISYTVFFWWGSTGVLIWLAHRSRRVLPWAFAIMTALLLLGLWQLLRGRADESVAGAYRAFTWATLVWGWVVLGYYSGLITGIPHSGAVREGGRFWQALRANLHHELLSLTLLLLLWATHQGAANQLGLWTFALLWAMHETSRLVVLLGVRNTNEHLLPRAFRQQMGQFLRRRPMNGAFPFVITGWTILTAVVIYSAATAPTYAARVGLTCLACLLALGVLEHWLLMLPVNMELWNWSPPTPAAPPATRDPERKGSGEYA